MFIMPARLYTCMRIDNSCAYLYMYLYVALCMTMLSSSSTRLIIPNHLCAQTWQTQLTSSDLIVCCILYVGVVSGELHQYHAHQYPSTHLLASSCYQKTRYWLYNTYRLVFFVKRNSITMPSATPLDDYLQRGSVITHLIFSNILTIEAP